MHQQNVRTLYKTILRLHRALPPEMRELGDQYVKDEFKRHKGVGKEHVAPFMMEWVNYCSMLANQVGLRGPKTSSERIGITLEESQLEYFEDQQLYQLYELRKSISPNETDTTSRESNSEGNRGNDKKNTS